MRSRFSAPFPVLALGCLFLGACATPPLYGGPGGGADASADPVKLEPMTAIVQPGALGDASADRFGWRRDTSAPIANYAALVLQGNLGIGQDGKPATEGSGSVSYPQLRTIVYAPVIVSAAGQSDPTLTKDQIKEVAAIAKAGAEAMRKGDGDAAEDVEAPEEPAPVEPAPGGEKPR